MQEQKQTFSDRLRQRRAEISINQDDLAERVGVSKTILSRYERGLANPRPNTLLRLAEALQCTTDWLEKGVVAASTDHHQMVELSVPRDLMTRIIDSTKESGREPVTEILFRLEESFKKEGSLAVPADVASSLLEEMSNLRIELAAMKGDSETIKDELVMRKIQKIVSGKTDEEQDD